MSACTSTGSARRPSTATVTQVPLTGVPLRDRNSPLGSATSAMPSPVISKQPTSSVGPKRFFVRAHEAQRGLPVALEAADDVDQVLEHPGAGDRAVFGDVADEQHRQVALLGDADEGARDLAHLRGLAGRALRHRRRDGLHRVDDQQAGAHGIDVAEDRGQVGLGGEVELVGARSSRAPVRSARMRTWLADSSALT